MRNWVEQKVLRQKRDTMTLQLVSWNQSFLSEKCIGKYGSKVFSLFIKTFLHKLSWINGNWPVYTGPCTYGDQERLTREAGTGMWFLGETRARLWIHVWLWLWRCPCVTVWGRCHGLCGAGESCLSGSWLLVLGTHLTRGIDLCAPENVQPVGLTTSVTWVIAQPIASKYGLCLWEERWEGLRLPACI